MQLADPLTDSVNVDFAVANDQIYAISNSVVTSTDVTPEIKIALWPNPCSQQLNIRSEGVLQSIKIYNLMLQEVGLDIEFNNQEARLDMSVLPRGVYLLYINGERVREKIIKP